jgi:hypothetical protein
LNEDGSNSYEIMTKDIAAYYGEIERLQIQLNDTIGRLEHEHSQLETVLKKEITLKNMIETETRMNRKGHDVANAREDTRNQLCEEDLEEGRKG